MAKILHFFIFKAYHHEYQSHFIKMSSNCFSSLWFGINVAKNLNNNVHHHIDDFGIRSSFRLNYMGN